jgi:hypothetical protein
MEDEVYDKSNQGRVSDYEHSNFAAEIPDQTTNAINVSKIDIILTIISTPIKSFYIRSSRYIRCEGYQPLSHAQHQNKTTLLRYKVHEFPSLPLGVV